MNGSKFNYVILGVTGNPGGVQKVILITRQSTATTVNTAQNNGRPGQPQYQQPSDEPQDEECRLHRSGGRNPAGISAAAARSRDDSAGPNIPVRNPEVNDQQQQDNNGNPPNVVKTPEQLLQELQNMQQQQQQYQQQLNPANNRGAATARAITLTRSIGYAKSVHETLLAFRVECSATR